MTSKDLSTYKHGKLSSVRNPDGIWINTRLFSTEATHFLKNGYYCPDPWNTPAWMDYWREQRIRSINGYSVGGVKITGDHYFYLNFTRMRRVKDQKASRSTKIMGFPDFWDGDYNYFWIREIARQGVFDSLVEGQEERKAFISLPSLEQAVELKKLFESLHLEVKIKVDYLTGGFNLIVGKARRRGYSLKSAATASKKFFHKPHSFTIFAAYEKKYLYPKGLFTMAKDNIAFLNEHSGWQMPSDVVNKQDHIRASYIEYKNGVAIEKGFKSEIQALTFKDNPDAARGKDADEVFFEESGAFGTPGLLKKAYKATEDVVRAGAIKTGLITIFGTSGDMDGGTYDYADMHSRPLAFGLLPFINIWDEGMEETQCGFFHPINWNMEGFYDEQGNSDLEGAKAYEIQARKMLIANGATSTEIQQRMQELPLGPAEAFASTNINNFPVLELKQQLAKVKAHGWQQIKGTPVNLIAEGGKVLAKPILDGLAKPITSFRDLPGDKRGCPIIYEYPVNNPPKGLYKIGYDPIRQEEGTSLAAICVYKSVHVGSLYHSILVAEYVGRYEDPDDIDHIAEKLAILYNTQIMYENEIRGVKTYFKRKKILHLLALQPDAVISKNVKRSKVARVYGCHMSPQLKDAGERYVKSWLLTVLDHDENGDPITVIDRIYSVRLLEELIAYHRKGNFDLVSALFMCMFQIQEEYEGKEYDEARQHKKAKQLLAMMDKMYKKR